MSITRDQLDKYLKKLLSPWDFSDYCPNGLQVTGKTEINKIAFAVSATRDSIEKAVTKNADALITHHGLFWKFHGPKTITGPFAKRVIPLIKNDINLFSYHLPLDAHLEIGNAASIAKKIGLTKLAPFGDHKGSPTGVKGKFNSPQDPLEIKNILTEILDHQVLHASPSAEKISSMGIITGGANSDWSHCLRENLDSYLTGEMSEHDWHESQEAGVHMFAGGHNATEALGVESLMDNIKKELHVDCFFISSGNPA